MKQKKFNVIGTNWHTGHQHCLAQLPFIGKYDLIMTPYRKWATIQRPFPENCEMVTHYEPGKYDFAILHVDQQSLYDGKKFLTKKGKIYSELNETIKDIPKIVINHMTPFSDDMPSDEVVDIMKEMIGDNIMVCNSYEAGKQWGWGNVITHGMPIDDWDNLPKEPRVAISISPAGMNKAYRREFIHNVYRELKDRNIPVVWVPVDRKFDTFEEYKDFIGRSLVFFHGAWQSPRPRARTEAMLSGACIVTTPYHDADTFIEDGINGFLTNRVKNRDPRIADNPVYVANLIEKLIQNPEWAMEVGKRGREDARKLFNMEQFSDQWENLLRENNIWK